MLLIKAKHLFRILILLFCFSRMTYCQAQKNKNIDSIQYKLKNLFAPSFSIGRSFNSNDTKIGLNLLMINEVEKYKSELIDDTFGYIKTNYPNLKYVDHFSILSSLSINHHFIKSYNNCTINSQSIELSMYYYYFTLVGIGCQVKHYGFKTICVSPQIKILPPIINCYFQRNFKQSSELYIPKYEFGMEFNPRIIYDLLTY